ncbi:glycoside hydrolase domain-containing protein [Streptomyces sp. NBC_00467]|uniref:glycoside hydrolase domain-containing protein n=1 Tax=Streptomyces sp. NBC_00467 TaxID=2975752 RepID=UPI002E181042
MEPRSVRCRRLWPVVATLLALVGGVAVAPAGADPVNSGTRTVGYHGYEIEVPDSWQVVDLTEQPDACIRFDRPTVYLGRPGVRSSCPAHLVGRTAGLLVEPLDASSAQRITGATARAVSGTAVAPTAVSRNAEIRVAVEDAGVLVTAAHTPETEPAVRRVLDSATLAAGAERTRVPNRADTAPLAAAGPQPGTFAGKGFDACAAPSAATMNAWYAGSPYRAVGVYISGATRACGQPNLTANWVTDQTARGWRLMPIDVGKQAPCSAFSNKMSTTPATARSQGSAAADASVAAAQSLGIPAGSALYSDIEGYPSTASCKASVLSYLSGWTDALHARGYLSGLYSSASSGIRDAATEYDNSAYSRVDHIWYAWWNNAADTNTGTYVPAGYWADHQRIHQYAGDVSETWGGVTVSIDRNFLDVRTASTPPTGCTTTNLSFTAYPTLTSGSTGSRVSAAQCLLRSAGHDPGAGTPTGTYDAGTSTAVRSFQTARGLPGDGITGPKTWTALLSRGSTPVIRTGSTGEAVTRIQRALTAALGRTVGIDGAFGAGTEAAVRDYQSSRGLSSDGIAGPATWSALQSGK